jgi:hypothetical protein
MGGLSGRIVDAYYSRIFTMSLKVRGPAYYRMYFICSKFCGTICGHNRQNGGTTHACTHFCHLAELLKRYDNVSLGNTIRRR